MLLRSQVNLPGGVIVVDWFSGLWLEKLVLVIMRDYCLFESGADTLFI